MMDDVTWILYRCDLNICTEIIREQVFTFFIGMNMSLHIILKNVSFSLVITHKIISDYYKNYFELINYIEGCLL